MNVLNLSGGRKWSTTFKMIDNIQAPEIDISKWVKCTASKISLWIMKLHIHSPNCWHQNLCGWQLTRSTSATSATINAQQPVVTSVWKSKALVSNVGGWRQGSCCYKLPSSSAVWIALSDHTDKIGFWDGFLLISAACPSYMCQVIIYDTIHHCHLSSLV